MNTPGDATLRSGEDERPHSHAARRLRCPGRIWSRLLHEEPLTEVVGHVDVDPANLAAAREMWSAPDGICFADLDEALAVTQPDLALLATPPMNRYEAMAVLDRGAHLLSEKPLTLDLDEGIALVRRAEEVGRALVVGLNFRYQHVVRYAKDLLASGELGRPSHARFVYWLNRSGYSPGGNRSLTMRQPMLYEQSIHHFDEMRFVYGAEVERLWCRCHNRPGATTPTTRPWPRSSRCPAACWSITSEPGKGRPITTNSPGAPTARTAPCWREQFSDLAVIRPDAVEPGQSDCRTRATRRRRSADVDRRGRATAGRHGTAGAVRASTTSRRSPWWRPAKPRTPPASRS